MLDSCRVHDQYCHGSLFQGSCTENTMQYLKTRSILDSISLTRKIKTRCFTLASQLFLVNGGYLEKLKLRVTPRRQEPHTEAEHANDIELIMRSCDVNLCSAQCLVAHEGKQEAVARTPCPRAVFCTVLWSKKACSRYQIDSWRLHQPLGRLVSMLSLRGGCGAVRLLW